jgi:hypothetical protein
VHGKTVLEMQANTVSRGDCPTLTFFIRLYLCHRAWLDDDGDAADDAAARTFS